LILIEKICNYPLNPPDHGYISEYSKNQNLVGTVVTTWCDTGFYLYPPNSFYTCKSDGLWHPNPTQSCISMPFCSTVNKAHEDIKKGKNIYLLPE